jgi:hypothetical protein
MCVYACVCLCVYACVCVLLRVSTAVNESAVLVHHVHDNSKLAGIGAVVDADHTADLDEVVTGNHFCVSVCRVYVCVLVCLCVCVRVCVCVCVCLLCMRRKCVCVCVCVSIVHAS